MNLELRKRIYTGIALFATLALMFISKIAYLYVSLIIFVMSFIEFSKKSKIIFKKKPIYLNLINFLFLMYLSFFLLVFILSVNNIHLKLILFMILLVCAASDIGGLIVGKLIKGPKLTKISPNKTIAGSIGSFIFSVTISYFLFKDVFLVETSQILYIGIAISLSVQLGDLLFSFLKRKSNKKNTGNILPGHGGLLDRIDGILLGVPIGLVITIIVLT